MTQQHIEELAKQGDISAIEALINELLEPNGIKAKVGLKDSCLYVALASAQIPEKQALVRCIGKRIFQLGIKSLQSAKIYAAQWGQKLPVWQQEIPLSPPRIDLQHRVSSTQALTGSQQAVVKVTVGKHSLQVDSTCGIIVSPGKQPHLRPRSQPVFLLPHPFPNLIGRLPQIKSALASLEAQQSIEFYGSSGVGKSALLRHIIYFIQKFIQKNAAFGDGAVWLADCSDLQDLLQRLFDLFCESNIIYKPTHSQIRRFLHNKKLLIFLDDAKLTSDDIKHLHSILPNSRFILASSSQKLFEGSSEQLLCLPTRDAIAFITQKLHGFISAEELITVEALAAKLSGQPYMMQLAVNCINNNVCSLSQLVLKLQPTARHQSLVKLILEALPLPHREILAVLATLDGIGALEVQIEALSEVSDASEILKSLLDWNLVDTEFNRYYLNTTLVPALHQELDLTPFYERTLSHFIAWAEKHQNHISTTNTLLDALIPILTWAKTAERWESILRLVKAIESTIVFSKRWGLGRQVLEYGLEAAITLSDKQNEAWMLHQLGSMALCLEDSSVEAREYLTKALQIRESLGLENAVAATRQNLKLVNISPSEPETSITQYRVNYTSTDTKLQFLAVTLIPLLCTGLAGLLAWYVLSHLITSPAPSGADKQPQKFKNVSAFSISSNNLNFGKQRINSESKSQTITITNDSSVSMRVAEIETTGTQADFEISNSTCASAILPNQSCDISIVFAPVEIGEHLASLPITNSEGKTLQQIVIKGVAISSQQPTQDIPTAPKREIQPPLPLSKPKLISPQTPQVVNRPIFPAPVAPVQVESPKLSTQSPEPIITEQPVPTVTESPEVFPDIETTPEIIETPEMAPDIPN